MRGSEFADLRAFATIVAQGNFARAATQLHVSPSALSQTIRALEARLGVRLLNRTTRSVSVTDAGSRLYARLKPVMEELEAAVADVNDLRERPAGTLRLTSSRVGAERFLAPILGRFHQAYPDIILDITVDDVVHDIVAEGYDAGIRLGEMISDDMVAIKLGGSLRQVAVAAPGYLARHGMPQHPRDLLDHTCINWRWAETGRIYHWEFQEPDGDWFSVAVKGPIIVTDKSLVLAAALQGVGIALWLEDRVVPYVEEGSLVTLLEEWAGSFPGFFLCYPKQRHTPLPLRVFTDFIRATYGS
ncbi:LysR family transcriptional regulator [Nitrospirillum pindoramense]|uniref:LysR family transcriptional regulator n=1 Tax=Nitrospirillum amazonense TaxID=28077 RepID=A0A560HAW4_9PROT|nr:LysR family transcriptional regulator [Nitrospirillum amazonense]TWB43477.1 LysR family transcriptional regulator [Nitrospirillum amazonense]